MARSKPKIPFLGFFFLLRNLTETLATQANLTPKQPFSFIISSSFQNSCFTVYIVKTSYIWFLFDPLVFFFFDHLLTSMVLIDFEELPKELFLYTNVQFKDDKITQVRLPFKMTKY